MALISDSHATAKEDQKKYWEDRLENTRRLSFEHDKAILALTQDMTKSYSMDTGQTTINYTSFDLPMLIDKREKYTKEVREIEEILAELNNQRPKILQAVPAW